MPLTLVFLQVVFFQKCCHITLYVLRFYSVFNWKLPFTSFIDVYFFINYIELKFLSNFFFLQLILFSYFFLDGWLTLWLLGKTRCLIDPVWHGVVGNELFSDDLSAAISLVLVIDYEGGTVWNIRLMVGTLFHKDNMRKLNEIEFSILFIILPFNRYTGM